MLNAHPEIDGIFAGDDSLAVIALHVARQKGINIPKDEDHRSRWNKADFRICSRTDNDQQPVKQIAKVAVDKLIDLIEGKQQKAA